MESRFNLIYLVIGLIIGLGIGYVWSSRQNGSMALKACEFTAKTMLHEAERCENILNKLQEDSN